MGSETIAPAPDQADAAVAWVRGDRLGLALPAHPEALRDGGEAFLTQAFRAMGALASDNAVVAIDRCEDFTGGGTGKKLVLTVRYARAGPPADLFVKFSRNFDDPIFDRAKRHMEPEIRLAALSRAPGFPIATPACLYGDFHAESGTGVLITERIAFGASGIEPHRPKCLDHTLADPLARYQALIRAAARLAGTHKAGRLPASVAEQFPFDLDAALAKDRLPDPDRLARKVAQIAAFQADYPKLLPEAVLPPDFLARFESEAQLFLAHEAAIKRLLHANPDLIALCHWNANIDNAWFWADAAGEIQCGLMDWGSVGQMSVAMTLWGCLSGMETAMWAAHLGELLDLFVREFEGCGGPKLDPAELRLHLQLYVVMMGLAWLMDAPARIRREPVDLAAAEGPHDPRFTASETARVQRLMMVNVLNLWRTSDLGLTLCKRFGSPPGPGS